jgi:WhiB family redox-sensing transcriptional regulator
VTSTRSRPPDYRRPETEVWSWWHERSAEESIGGVFFPPYGERGHARARREARAKDMCRRCPVEQRCRAHALTVGEPYGLWGGLSESERLAATRRPERSQVTGL